MDIDMDYEADGNLEDMDPGLKISGGTGDDHNHDHNHDQDMLLT